MEATPFEIPEGPIPVKIESVQTDTLELEYMEEIDGDLVEDEPAASRPVLAVAEEEARASQAEGAFHHARLIAIYQREIEALTTPEAQSDKANRVKAALYHHEIGELLETRASDEGAAVKAYGEALKSDPKLKPNLWAIRRIFERRGLWPNLLKLLDAEIRLEPDPAERSELLVDKGHLLEDRMADVAAALKCYWEAGDSEPSNLSAWMALEAVYSKAENLPALDRAWTGLIAATPGTGRKAALMLDLAQLRAERARAGEMDQLDAAFSTLRTGLGLFVATERFLDEMEKIAAEHGRTDVLLEALDRRHEFYTGKEDANVLKALQKRRQAQLLAASDSVRAKKVLREALESSPGDKLLLEDLLALEEPGQDASALDPLYEQKGREAPETMVLGTLFERARLRRVAGQEDRAQALIEEVRARNPRHLGLLARDQAQALRRGDFERLLALYRLESELALSGEDTGGPPDAKWAASALCQAASFASEHLDRDEEAVALLERALELDPGHEAALDALERILWRGNRIKALIALLDAELTRAERTHREIWLLDSLVAAHEADGDPVSAEAAARRLSEKRPGDLDARLRLIDLGRAAKKYETLVADLRALEPLVEERLRFELMFERAEILEQKLEDLPGAIEAYKEALRVRPGSARAGEALESLSHRGQDLAGKPETWDELARALRRDVDAHPDGEKAKTALLKLAQLHERERKSPIDAQAIYREVAERFVDSRAALAGLERTSRALGDQAEVARALERSAGEMDGADDRARTLVLLGELEEGRGRLGEARSAYERSTAEAGNAHAALGLFRLAVREHDPAQMIEAVRAMAPFAGGDALDEERLGLELLVGDRESAVASLPSGATLTDSLEVEALLLSAGQHAGAELGTRYRALSSRTKDSVTQAQLLARSGALAVSSGHRAEGEAELRQALALKPHDLLLVRKAAEEARDPAAMASAARLSSGPSRLSFAKDRLTRLAFLDGAPGEETARALGDLLRESPDDVELLTIAKELAAGQDALEKAQASLELAQRLKTSDLSAQEFKSAAASFIEAGDHTAAAACLRAALEGRPGDVEIYPLAVELFQEIYQETREPGPLLELYSHRIESPAGDGADEHHLAAAYLERARLLRYERDYRGAEADLRRLMELDPADLEAPRELAEILSISTLGLGTARELLYRVAGDEPYANRRRATWVRIAELEEREPGHELQAVICLREALAIAPGAAEEERLAEILERQGNTDEAVEALERLIALTDGIRRSEFFRKIAALVQKENPKRAIAALSSALDLDRMDLEALHSLVDLSSAGHLGADALKGYLDHSIAEGRVRIADPALAVAPDRAERRGQTSASQLFSAMEKLFGWTANADAKLLAARAVALFGDRAPPSGGFTGAPVPPPLSEAQQQLLLGEAARSPALSIWRLVGGAAARIYDPSLEDLGIGKGDRINRKKSPEGIDSVLALAQALSFDLQEIYLASNPDQLASIGGALVVGKRHRGPLGSAALYRLTERLLLVRDQLGPLERIGDEELDLFFAATAKVAELEETPTWAPTSASAQLRIDEYAKVIQKATDRGQRKELRGMQDAFVNLGSLGAWRRAMLDGIARVALAVSGDLSELFARRDLKIGRDAGVIEWMAFAISPELLGVRRELGLGGRRGG